MEEKISALIAAAEKKLAPAFKRLEAIEEIGTRRVLAAFQEHQVAYRHFAPTTGYGYDDVGRDTIFYPLRASPMTPWRRSSAWARGPHRWEACGRWA